MDPGDEVTNLARWDTGDAAAGGGDNNPTHPADCGDERFVQECLASAAGTIDEEEPVPTFPRSREPPRRAVAGVPATTIFTLKSRDGADVGEES